MVDWGLATMDTMDTIHPPLRLEILNAFDDMVIQFLVDGMWSCPVSFARERETAFTHPQAYTSMVSGLSRGRWLMDRCMICPRYTRKDSLTLHSVLGPPSLIASYSSMIVRDIQKPPVLC